ncbi:MAG: hypothetical protein QXS85_01070 [Acidilobaceae archaeon]
MTEGRVEKTEPDKSRIRHILSRIPPPSALRESQERAVRERRLRIVYDSSVKPGYAKVHTSLAKSLGVESYLEVVAAGKDPLVLKAILEDSVEEARVHVNPEEMKTHGIADNSIVTVRAARKAG